MCGFAFAFDNAQQFGVGRQVSDHIIRLAAMVSLGEEIETAIYHFHGDGRKRLGGKGFLELKTGQFKVY